LTSVSTIKRVAARGSVSGRIPYAAAADLDGSGEAENDQHLERDLDPAAACDRVGCLPADPLQRRRSGIDRMPRFGERVRDMLDPVRHDGEKARPKAVGDELRLSRLLRLRQQPELLDELSTGAVVLKGGDERLDLLGRGRRGGFLGQPGRA
jgi:hypothetical protein